MLAQPSKQVGVDGTLIVIEGFPITR